MSASKPLGVVVVDYHTTNDLREFCRSLLDSDPQIPYSLLIAVVDAVDMEAVTASEFADLFVGRTVTTGIHPYATNVGFNIAVNDAARWSLKALDTLFDPDEMSLVFFNSDTRLRSGVLESCVDLLWSDESYGAVGPRQVSEAGRFTAAGIFGTLEQPRHRAWQEPAGDKHQDIRTDAVTVAGSAYMVKAPVWTELAECPAYTAAAPDALGAFLPCKHYYGETWCSYHMHAHDYRLVYNGTATMVHNWHQASPMNQQSFGERHLASDRELFRNACNSHRNHKFPQGIPHD